MDSARNISSKFKSLRARLKQWSKKISNLQLLISNCNAVISTLDSVEDQRGLYHPEMNLRIVVKAQLKTWLKCKNIY